MLTAIGLRRRSCGVAGRMPSWVAILAAVALVCGPLAGMLFIIAIIKGQDE